MKLNKKHNQHRKFIKRWKTLFIEQGKIAASAEYQKKLDILAKEYKKAEDEKDRVHESHIKVLTRKEQEFQHACDDVNKLKARLKDELDNVLMVRAEIEENARKIKVMLHDEKKKREIEIDYTMSSMSASVNKVVNDVRKLS